jgi:hypothetical protein
MSTIIGIILAWALISAIIVTYAIINVAAVAYLFLAIEFFRGLKTWPHI